MYLSSITLKISKFMYKKNCATRKSYDQRMATTIKRRLAKKKNEKWANVEWCTLLVLSFSTTVP